MQPLISTSLSRWGRAFSERYAAPDLAVVYCIELCRVVAGRSYLGVGTEQGADGAVGIQVGHGCVEGLLGQEVWRAILPQVLVLLHVAL